MRTLIGTIAVAVAFSSLAHAQESAGDKVGGVKDEAVQTKRKAGAEVREAGREVKAEGRKARQAVITRCADGRHTVQGASGCAGHGGVRDPK